MRAIMDAISDPDVHTLVVVSCSQIGKTELILNTIGYHIDQDPAPILLIQPTLEMAEDFSKDRLAPMIRDTPVLLNKMGDPRTRDSGNNLRHKSFPGGHVTMAGSNSPSSLASRPIRIVLADEVDRYKASAGTEGDPVNLAKKRAQTFWNRKLIMVSTPGTKGLSRIEAEYELSDKNLGYVPCEDCGHWQTLRWEQVQWPSGHPERAMYVCEACGSCWDDPQRWRSIKQVEFWPEAPFSGIRGFRLNEMYSSWAYMGETAVKFLADKRSPETLRTFVNTVLGESFEEDAERVDSHALMGRLEGWGDPEADSSDWPAPQDVLVITCGVDVQDDRVEVERVGWGVDEESWSLDHQIIYGDPSAPELWNLLDEYLLTPTHRADGAVLPVHAVAVDSGGHHTAAVYRFCAARFRRRVYAIKGVGGPGRIVWPKRATKVKDGALLFPIGVDAAKDAVYARLKVAAQGPGYCHFPEGREYVYFDQLTAERVVTKYVKGFPTRVYEKPNTKRNEALDIRVYAYAVLQALNIRWGRLLAFEQARSVPSPKRQRQEPEPGVREFPPQRSEEPTASLPSKARPQVQGRHVVRKSSWMS